MKRLLLPLLILCCLPLPAAAFKIETHLWLADQIYNELRRNDSAGRPRGLRIADRNYQINGELRAAILQHKGAFLMGVLGADLYPDMVAGQMTMHPGVNEIVNNRVSWQSDDWVNHVIRSAENTQGPGRHPALAFAAGYALHPAMDLWAHTYVNLYSGDEFSMLSNTEAAERHVALENYLTNFHRSVLDLYPPRRRSDYLTSLRVPASFVRKTLILNDLAAAQYQREITTVYLAAIHAQYRGLEQLRDRVRTFNEAIANEIQRLPELITAYEQALSHRDNMKAILEGHLAVLRAGGRTVAQAAVDGAVGTLNNLGFGELADDVEDAANFMDETAIRMTGDLEAAANALQDRIDDFGYGAVNTFDPKEILRRLQEAVGALPESVLVDWRRDIERAMDEYVKAWELTGKEIMRPSARRFSSGADPKGPILRWAKCWAPTLATPLGSPAVSTGCQNVLQNYSNARNRFQSLKVELLSRIPGATPVMDTLEAVDQLAEGLIATTISSVADKMDAVFPPTGVDGAGFANLAVRLWDKSVDAPTLDASYLNSGQSAGEAYITAPVSRFVNRDLKVCRGMPTPASRYSQFPIGDFAPIQNAVTLSKLTLLSSGGLNAVIQDLLQRDQAAANAPQKGAPTTQAGATKSAPGKLKSAVAQIQAQATPATTYYTSPRMFGAVLLGAIRSIDGDHGWQPVAPPLPRAGNAPQDSLKTRCRRFGHTADSYGNEDCDGEGGTPASLPACRARASFSIVQNFGKLFLKSCLIR